MHQARRGGNEIGDPYDIRGPGYVTANYPNDGLAPCPEVAEVAGPAAITGKSGQSAEATARHRTSYP